MNEKVGEVFSIAKDNAPVPGCTISKAVHSGENDIIYFSLAIFLAMGYLNGVFFIADEYGFLFIFVSFYSFFTNHKSLDIPYAYNNSKTIYSTSIKSVPFQMHILIPKKMQRGVLFTSEFIAFFAKS